MGRLRSLLIAAALAAPSAAPAFSQVDFATSVGPESFAGGSGGEFSKPSPLPLALSLLLDATGWASVGLSSAPRAQLESLMGRGYYKLELIQLTLMARKGGTPLTELASRRSGKSLRRLAESLSLDYDALYQESLGLAAGVDERLASLWRVESSTRALSDPLEKDAPGPAEPARR